MVKQGECVCELFFMVLIWDISLLVWNWASEGLFSKFWLPSECIHTFHFKCMLQRNTVKSKCSKYNVCLLLCTNLTEQMYLESAALCSFMMPITMNVFPVWMGTLLVEASNATVLLCIEHGHKMTTLPSYDLRYDDIIWDIMTCICCVRWTAGVGASRKIHPCLEAVLHARGIYFYRVLIFKELRWCCWFGYSIFWSDQFPVLAICATPKEWKSVARDAESWDSHVWQKPSFCLT